MPTCLHRMYQVLCCEVDAIFSTLLGDPNIMAALFSLLELQRPLDCMLTGYFSRVITGLLQRRGRDVQQYLQVSEGLGMGMQEGGPPCRCTICMGGPVSYASVRYAVATVPQMALPCCDVGLFPSLSSFLRTLDVWWCATDC